MGGVAALLCVAAGVHCASEDTGGILRIGMYVNDLVIPEDTNLMGLYLAEIQAAGRYGKVHAFEAAPLRDGDTTYVLFPASLVVASGEQTARLHARLVAFHVDASGARKALTMREARAGTDA